MANPYMFGKCSLWQGMFCMARNDLYVLYGKPSCPGNIFSVFAVQLNMTFVMGFESSEMDGFNITFVLFRL